MALDGDLELLRKATEVAFGGVGFTGRTLPVTAAYQRVREAGAGARTEIGALLETGTPAGCVYAAALLDSLEPAGNQRAWRRLTNDERPVTVWDGCVRTDVTVRSYATRRIAESNGGPGPAH